MQFDSGRTGKLRDEDSGVHPSTIRQATALDLDSLVPLFDQYRQFYRQPSNIEGAKQFLLDRFRFNQSIVFMAFSGNTPVGFTQFYPSFLSGAMAQILVLNDLFVVPEERARGVGTALLEHAAGYARRIGAMRLVLSTEITNANAQSLYEKLGWKRDTVFCVYTLTL